MKERILEFLKSENKSSAQLASEIGVQPSSISHILSGRNNPSLDFVLKMLGKYDYVSAEWLLFGRGSMYSHGAGNRPDDDGMDLFSDTGHADVISDNSDRENIRVNESRITDRDIPEKIVEIQKKRKGCIRIVCFYQDSTFREYFTGE